jgi:diketogulonate reductase-like aldo/keto reductase
MAAATRLTFPRIGMGTWHMGEARGRRREEVAALRLGLELGLTLVDTAEMYGDGGAEEVVGEAIRGRRDGLQVVTKFYPHHASRRELPVACERSRSRLGVDTIDLYLYHWRGRVPLAETVDALEALCSKGHIRRWGVSNFDLTDLQELAAVPGGDRVAANQVLYNLERRGIEFDLIPWCRARGIGIMAYSPLDEGPLAHHPALARVAAAKGLSAAELAIAWASREAQVCAIPKASNEAHVRANVRAASVTLDAQTLAQLDELFPPPRRKQRLAII